MRRVLAGGRVFTGDRIVEGCAVVLDGGRIAGVVAAADAPADVLADVRLPAGSLLVPGFLDLQVNGAGGVLFNDAPTAETALTIAAVVRRTGTTGVLPTLMTDEPGKLSRACAAAAAALARPAGGVLGLHLEGPFLSPERPGVHLPRWMRRPGAADIDLIADTARRFGDRGRLLVTLAPECVDDRDIARLTAAGATVAAGHTAATLERTRAALAAGVRGFTHLFNAMSPMLSRQPGPVAAALADPDAWCCIIADGLHVHPALLRLLVQVKPRGKVVVVTDAMPPSGTAATSFTLFGKTISRAGGRLVTDDGTLAGADIDMAGSVRNCVELLDLPLEEALRMASLYPATYLGLGDQLGRIAAGYRADLTLLRPDGSVLATWVDGDEEWYGDAASLAV